MRLMCYAAMLAGCMATAPTVWAASTTQDQFLLRSTSDLVALCTAEPSDPQYTAAQNFCHGFAVGTFRALFSVQQAMRTQLFCRPSTSMTRTEAIAAFVKWARPSADVMALPPTDGIFRFLTEQSPCK